MRRRRWWWALVVVIVMLPIGWWWLRWHASSRLPVMRLVGCIPLGEDFLLSQDSRPSCFATPYLLLRLQRESTPGTLTLLGWDLHPHWQVSVPVPRKMAVWHAGMPDEGPGTLALSPDGHVLALVHRADTRVQIWSWRDGHALGEAEFRWPDKAATASPAVQVTDAGRVWLSAIVHTPSFTFDLRCWAVDGSRTAAGRYTPSCPNYNDIAHTDFSPDGKVLLTCNGQDTTSSVVDGAAVRVQGAQVMLTHVYTETAAGQRFTWHGDETAVDAAGKQFGPSGATTGKNAVATAIDRRPCLGYLASRQGKPRYCVLPLPPAPAWDVPASAQLFGSAMRCPADGETLFVLETRSLSRAPAPDGARRPSWLGKLWAAQPESEQLAVYTAPGALRAVLPLPFLLAEGAGYTADPQQLALAPEHHRLAMLGNGQDGKRALLVYEW